MDDEIIIGINRKEPPKKSKKTKKKKKTVKASVKKEAKMGKGSTGKKQSKKGNSNNTVIVKIVLAIIVFVAIIIGLSNVPLFNIKNIEVVGNTKLSEDKIIDFVGFFICVSRVSGGDPTADWQQAPACACFPRKRG